MGDKLFCANFHESEIEGKEDVDNDISLVSLRNETLILSFSLTEMFYRGSSMRLGEGLLRDFPESSGNEVDLEVENMIKVFNYGSEKLIEDIKNKVADEIGLGERYTLFLENIDLYFGLFLTKRMHQKGLLLKNMILRDPLTLCLLLML